MTIVTLNGSSAVQTASKEPVQLQTPLVPQSPAHPSPVQAEKAAKAVNNVARGKEPTQSFPSSESGEDIEEVKEIVNELNEYMDDLQTNLGFSIHEELGHQVVVEIKNRQTDEIVRQIPSEALLKIREKMVELTGMFFDGHF